MPIAWRILPEIVGKNEDKHIGKQRVSGMGEPHAGAGTARSGGRAMSETAIVLRSAYREQEQGVILWENC